MKEPKFKIVYAGLTINQLVGCMLCSEEYLNSNANSGNEDGYYVMYNNSIVFSGTYGTCKEFIN